MEIKGLLLLFITILFIACNISQVGAELSVGFYNTSCPAAESIVQSVVQARFKTDATITPALLRMHFHDCFVTGCDASILIDSTSTNSSEKDAFANQSVRGFELIDEAKLAVESACPSIVSCSDIITLATRDAVALAGGPKYNVPTGRRDGLVSDQSQVKLPGPTFSISDASKFFTSKGLTVNDMVVLLGAHTVGFAHCGTFRDRLFNFQGTGKPDPSMDVALAAKLLRICGIESQPLKTDPRVLLDQNTSFLLDSKYYNQVISNKGVLKIDQELASDTLSSTLVAKLAADEELFRTSFSNALIKMGNIGVVVGKNGEIRENCRVFNERG